MNMKERAYTTFQISRFCNVNHRTVLYWINRNKLKAFKTVGGHSRVRENDLREFFVHHGIPVPDELQESERHICVIDDEPGVLEFMRQVFDSTAYKVTTWDNGIDALMHLGKVPADVIFIGMFMPYMDGFEVCRRIRRNPLVGSAFIVAVSGEFSREIDAQVRAAGANDFIVKPFNADDVRRRVQTMLGK
jgi:excisionase family DNA binding protein